jgi:hypothetical protein
MNRLKARFALAGAISLAIIVLLRDPIERYVLYTPLTAPVMIVVYGAAVIGPWWVLGMRGKQDGG